MRHVLIIVGFIFLAGCVTEPDIGLYQTRVAGAGPPGLTMNMTMIVRNDNSFDIQIRNVRASVLLDGRYSLPPLVASPNKWLRAGQTDFVTVPVTVPWNMVPPISAAAARGPFVHFRVKGFADVTATRSLEIDRNDWELDQRGSVSSIEIITATGRGHLPGFPGQRNVGPWR